MLINGNDRQKCPFGDEIVAYIYDEIHSSQRGKFESHLAGCTVCTDEFAGISNARFSIFEWRKVEFAHLPTPKIAIPYRANSRDVERAGFFAGLRGLSVMKGSSSAVMVAGAVLICVGLGYVAMNYVGNNSQLAGNNKSVDDEKAAPPVMAPDQQSVAVLPSTQLQKETNGNEKTISASTRTPPPNREIRPARASIETRKIREKNLTASRLPGQPSIQQKRKAPALTAYDDDDDKSLRLADLFDEGGV